MTTERSQQPHATTGGTNRSPKITTLFLDIGGVLLTDGWDQHARNRAATDFKLEFSEMEDRHHLVFETYEVGKLTLDEYLDRTVFYEARPFTREQFQEFMFAQSNPHPEMIELFARAQRSARSEDRRRQQRSSRAEFVSDSKVQTRQDCGLFHFFLLCAPSQARQ